MIQNDIALPSPKSSCCIMQKGRATLLHHQKQHQNAACQRYLDCISMNICTIHLPVWQLPWHHKPWSKLQCQIWSLQNLNHPSARYIGYGSKLVTYPTYPTVQIKLANPKNEEHPWPPTPLHWQTPPIVQISRCCRRSKMAQDKPNMVPTLAQQRPTQTTKYP